MRWQRSAPGCWTPPRRCSADWRLFCPERWDDHAAGDGVAAAAIRHRRGRAGIPDQIRHTEKWRLALEMTGAGTGGTLGTAMEDDLDDDTDAE